MRGQSRPAPAYPGASEGRGLTRRTFGALAGAAAFAPSFARADAPTPILVAEGGSSERPQDSRSAYDLAINEGCDFIQANLVLTKEGILAIRRDIELSATTDVGAHPEFAARKATKTVDGASVTGWFAEDFTLPELKTLKCCELWPKLRPASAKFNGKDEVLSLQEVLAIARAGCVRTARTVGVMPRILHAGYYESLGQAVEERLASELTTSGYFSAVAAVWVQAFEPDALKTFGRSSQLRRMQMVPAGDATMTSGAGLAEVRSYAEAICADQSLVFDPAGAVFPTPTTLTLDAHNARLQVYSFAARAENQFLPKGAQRGNPKSASFPGQHGDVDKLLLALFANGLDGVSTDEIAAAAKARQAAVDAFERLKNRRR